LKKEGLSAGSAERNAQKEEKRKKEEEERD
jgi:hypothetical protein